MMAAGWAEFHRDLYGIATVVGTRTWGGTRGVDFKYTLVDGTLVAQGLPRMLHGPGGGPARQPPCAGRPRHTV
jgi:hypothetical protein